MTLVFVLSFAAWIVYLVFQNKYGNFHNRRQVSGYETARLILDGRGFASVLIASANQKQLSPQTETLFLPADVYEGVSLKYILRAARAAFQHSRSKFWQTSGDFPETLPLWTSYASFAAWTFLFLTILFKSHFFSAASGFLWWGIFLTALFAFLEERENEKMILKALKETQLFEVDECVKVKKLLRAYRFSGFCLPFRYLSIGGSFLRRLFHN